KRLVSEPNEPITATALFELGDLYRARADIDADQVFPFRHAPCLPRGLDRRTAPEARPRLCAHPSIEGSGAGAGAFSIRHAESAISMRSAERGARASLSSAATAAAT